MKKLMFICSLSCMFLLTTTSLSAQFVTKAEAKVLLEDKIKQSSEATATKQIAIANYDVQTNATASTSSTASATFKSQRGAEIFYTKVYKGLLEREVAVAINDAHQHFVNTSPARKAMYDALKAEAIELLTL